MNLCSSGHDEICHTGHRCPMCDLMTDHKQTLESIDERSTQRENELNETITELQGTVKNLELTLLNPDRER